MIGRVCKGACPNPLRNTGTPRHRAPLTRSTKKGSGGVQGRSRGGPRSVQRGSQRVSEQVQGRSGRGPRSRSRSVRSKVEVVQKRSLWGSSSSSSSSTTQKYSFQTGGHRYSSGILKRSKSESKVQRRVTKSTPAGTSEALVKEHRTEKVTPF